MVVHRKMSDDEKQLFMIFKNAVESERNAQETYQKAMNLCADPALKAVLKSFCDDEMRHEKEIMKRYQIFRAMYEADSGSSA